MKTHVIAAKKVFARMRRLDVFEGGVRDATANITSTLRGSRGCAYMRRKHAVIRLDPKDTTLRHEVLMLHELSHLSLPENYYHNEDFIVRLYAAASEWYGVEVLPDWSVPRGQCRCKAYAMQREHLMPTLARVRSAA